MRLFFSYVIMIVLFFSAYAASIIAASRSMYRQNAEQDYQQKTIAVANQIDFQLLSAQNIVSAINSSETIKALYSRLLVEQGTVDSLLFNRTQTEIKSIKASSNNLSIYNVLLSFKDDAPPALLAETPYLGSTTVAELWNVHNSSNLHINKQYLIYGDRYFAAQNSTTKGNVLVLLEQSSLLKLLHTTLGNVLGIALRFDGQPVLQEGGSEGVLFSASSSLHRGVDIQVYVAESAFVQPFLSAEFMPLFIALAVGVAFIVATYFVAKQYYAPIGNIERIIGAGEPSGGNEIEGIITGLRNLIGERNGYREKMVTITPFAKQGMLHGLLSGDMRQDSLRILINEQHIDLRLPYFMLGQADIVHTGPQDAQTVYIIINSNLEDAFEDTFYMLHRRIAGLIESQNYVITIGVGLMESDIGRLHEACEAARKALDHMLVGGRNSVYFLEPGAGDKDHTYQSRFIALSLLVCYTESVHAYPPPHRFP